MLLQPVSLLVVRRKRLAVQIGLLVVQACKVLLIRLVACRAGIAAAVSPSQRRRLTHGVLHGLLPLLLVLLGIHLIHRIAGRVVLETAASQNLVQNAGKLAHVLALEGRRLLGDNAVQFVHGVRHVLTGRVAVCDQSANGLLGAVGNAREIYQPGNVRRVPLICLCCLRRRLIHAAGRAGRIRLNCRLGLG